MKRVARELQLHLNGNGCSVEGNILLQGVRFAYRIHQVNPPLKRKRKKKRGESALAASFCGVILTVQDLQFAGGFDEETIRAFEELKKFRSG